MEKKHKQRLRENFPDEMQNKDVFVLDIADDYKYMDEALIEIIQTSVTPYLQKTNDFLQQKKVEYTKFK